MRLLHTADWHLGRRFFNRDLIEDQAHVLDQVIRIAEEGQVDAVVVAGDIYDRGTPSTEAIRLLDDVLTRLVLRAKIPVVLIAGNHDNDDRLAFGSRLMEESGLYMGRETPDPYRIILADGYGPVHFIALPYVDPPHTREILGDQSLTTNDKAFGAWITRSKAGIPNGERSVLVAHAFVAGGAASDSERPLEVGGSGAVNVSHLAGFSYVALGHLHRPQASWGDRIHYSGSLLKYSFSESAQAKSVNLVEMDANGDVQVERVTLQSRRDVRCLRGTIEELLRAAATDPAANDYILAMLLDRGPVLDAMTRLQQAYPNALHIERPELTGHMAAVFTAAERGRLSETDLFASFFRDVTGETLTEAQSHAFAATVEKIRKADAAGEGA